MPRARGHVWIGTSGWNYNHWKDLFYQDVRQADWLRHYARHFPTVEINNTFYRKPTPATVRAWAATTPPGFIFAIKMWRGITHYRKLKDASDLLEKFMPIIHELEPAKRGPLLVQLPGNYKRNGERLNAFLIDLKRSMDRAGWLVAVEFRNPDWLHDEIYAILDRHHAAICLADMPACTITQPNDARFIYIRRHGAQGWEGQYQPEQVRADAEQIRRWLADGRDVFVYYNNDWHGHALTNARQITEQLHASAARVEAG